MLKLFLFLTGNSGGRQEKGRAEWDLCFRATSSEVPDQWTQNRQRAQRI